MDFDKAFSSFATRTAKATGSPAAFLLCVVVVVAWAVSGPIFKFSETWQLVINTGTTIITFLMVFLIQNTQNRDGAAVQAKLDELILTSDAENEYIGIEKLSDKELETLHARFAESAVQHRKVAEEAKQELISRKGKRTRATNARAAKAKTPASGPAKPVKRANPAATRIAAKSPTPDKPK